MKNENIKVVILCGGMGTRLREETEFKPKPMVEIGGKPILWHIMKSYASYGFNDFVLCLGFKGELIKQYFLNYQTMNCDVTVELGSGAIEFHNSHQEQGWHITLSDTGKNALTGARVKRIEKYIDGELFMLTYGDGVADVDIKKLLEFHKSHGKIGTVTGVYPSSRFGELVIDGDSVKEFSEKPQIKEGLINSGFFVFNRKFFDYLKDDDDCTLEREPLEKLASDCELNIYKHKGFWQCMDTYRDMMILNDIWKTNPAWKVWRD
jgi:glucose-1-phosphate cytidylyltransferase